MVFLKDRQNRMWAKWLVVLSMVIVGGVNVPFVAGLLPDFLLGLTNIASWIVLAGAFLVANKELD